MADTKLINNVNVGYYHSDIHNSIQRLHDKQRKMTGVKRVLVFCLLIVFLPAALIIIPLYLRKIIFADVVYPVAESDIIEIRDGISSIFCQQHSLRMSSNFNAFQLRSRPEVSTNRKHIRLKKSMTLPDDTLEYWGFYLLKGAQVHLKFCSRYDGSRILVVKGERNLKTCGLLEHNKNKVGANFAQGHEGVKVYFEDIKEFNMPPPSYTVSNEQNATRSFFNKTKEHWSDNEDENHAGEDLSDQDGHKIPIEHPKFFKHSKSKKTESNAINKQHTNKTENQSSNSLGQNLQEEHESDVGKNETHDNIDNELETVTETLRRVNRKRRHPRQHDLNNLNLDESIRKQQVYDSLYKAQPNRRQKRDHVYDRRYSHGGNAVNFTQDDESNSISSFENGLFSCYDGDILLAEGFPPSSFCSSVHFLDSGITSMMTKHEVAEDGYYYYIFYSDNDLVRNDIHAIFDIYKPTFQYSNLTDSQGCINSTNCTFPISFLSNEIVVVEIPTRDGIEHEEDDVTELISTCHPRTHVYAIFPISVLVLILSCAFL